MKNKKILVYSLVLLLVLSIIGITYAYFNTKISGNSNAKDFTAISKVIKIEYSDGTEKLISNDNLFKPGSIIVKKFTVTNTGDDDLDYTIYLENVTNTFNRVNDITYELYDSSDNKIYEGIFPKIDNIISDTYKLKKNESTSYTLKVIYNNSEENQIEDSGKTIDAKISFVGATLKSTLLKSAKEASASSSTTRTTLGSEVTTFTGISGANEHVLNTAPDDYGTSYYYRGNVIDNYVDFGNLTYKDDVVVGYMSEGSDYMNRYSSLSECQSSSLYNVNCTLVHKSGEPILWRIVRINGDGTIRLILDDFAGFTSFSYANDDNAYVGYMYGIDGIAGSTTYEATHENKNDSTIKVAVGKWYEDNLKTNYASYLSDTLFCGDKTLAESGIGGVTTQLGYGTNKTYYSSTERLLYSSGTTTITTFTPTLKCSEKANDNYSRYTTTKNILPDGKETNGNLKYPIGLLTADEVVYAGASTIKANTTYYLVNPSITTSWHLLTPSYYDNQAFIWGVFPYGGVYEWCNPNEYFGLRPVINLKAQVLINGGDGTKENPYTVKLS